MSVAAALEAYARRGVFRGLSTTRRRGGRDEHDFTWLMQRRFALTHDPARGLLSFRSLLPHVPARSPIATALRRLVAERTTRHVPPHKRLDRRTIRVSCGIRRGSFWLTFRVQPGGEARTVPKLLSVVNDLFVEMHEKYPDYLIAEFGLREE